MFFYKIALIFVCATCILCSRNEMKTEEDMGVKYANRCEVCKVLATELQSRLEETGKVHDVIEIGYSLDDVQPKKKTKYQKSELRLIESLDGVCERILEYNIHKERQDSTRFAKGMSQTFKTLHGLVDKGVKVDLGMPYELWDKPSAEITNLKTQCESLLEDNEEAIEHWYWNLQGTKDLKVHLCSDHALRDSDKSCLFEEPNLKGDKSKELKQNSKLNDESAKLKNNIITSKQPEDPKDTDKENDDDDFNYEDLQNHKSEQVSFDSVEKLQLTNKHIKEDLSNKPDIKNLKNEHRTGNQGESYWTEPVEYAKKQLLKDEVLINESEKANLETNEEVWIPEELLPKREEL